MAQDINDVLYLLKADGTSLENIKIEKFIYSAAAMSLDDKLSGSFLYPDLSLLDKLTRQEYVEYQGQKYWLQTTPNIEQKGLLSDNSDMQGMIRYTCEFTPQKAALYNIPFTDIARPNTNESLFRVGGREFFLFSRIDEFISRIDANLMYHTKESASDPNRWKCVLVDGFDVSQVKLPDEVMSFQGVFISDALKTLYDTYNVPYNVLGKTIYVGVPVNEVGHVFKFGQGVGLANNDRVRKDNKVITRLAYAGSEQNLPFRYPIIIRKSDGTIIDHPYHQNRLMPTSYVEAVRRKVDTTVPDHDPNIELTDYIEAIGSDFVTQINPNLPVYHYQTFDDIYPTIKDLIHEGNPIDTFKSIVTTEWDDYIDRGSGEVRQPHFEVELHPMGFDLWACAAVQDIMTFWMNTGDCQGSKFQVGYNAEAYDASFYVKDDNGAPVFNANSPNRNRTLFPDSTDQSIKLQLLKDIESFGTIMPNQWQQPKVGDKYVIINIELPQIYIDKAQVKLDEDAKQYLIENNFDKFDYPLVFDAHYLAENRTILSQINTNTLVPFEYKGILMKLPVQTISIQYGDNAIPKYDIKLTDEITVNLNSVGAVAEGLNKLDNVVAVNEVKGARQAANFFQGLRKAEEGIFDVDGMPKLKLVEALLIKANSLFIGSENRNFAPIDAAMTIGLTSISISESQIIHYNVSRTAEYDVEEARWFMQPFFINTLNPTKDYYVYVHANRINNSAQWVVLEKIETNQMPYGDDPNVFWFYWGQLNIINNKRETYPEWGMSVFSGGTQWQMITKSPNFVMNENQFVGMMIDWLNSKIYMGDGAELIAKNISIRTPGQDDFDLYAGIRDAQNYIDNLHVGGRNLLLNSNFANDLTSWYRTAPWGTITVMEDATFGQCVKISGEGWVGIYNVPSRTPGFTYTFSAYVRSNSGTVAGLIHEGGEGTQYYQATPNWTRIVGMGVWGGGGAVVLMMADAGELYFANAQYEEGTIATAWSPAPEDVPNSLKTTGIDIDNRRININAENTFIGNKTLITSDGLIRGDRIEMASAHITDLEAVRGNIGKMSIVGGKLSMNNDNISMIWQEDPVPLLSSLAGGTTVMPPMPDNLNLSVSYPISTNFEINGGAVSYSQPVTINFTQGTLNVAANHTYSGIAEINAVLSIVNNLGVEVVRLASAEVKVSPAESSMSESIALTRSSILLPAGTYFVRLSGFYNIAHPSGGAGSVSANITGVTGSAIYISRVHIASPNGSVLYFAANMYYYTSFVNGVFTWEVRNGNYGLKLTNVGLQRMTNGSTWTTF